MRLRSLWLLLPVTTACVTPSVASRPDRGIDAPLPGEGPAPMVIVDRDDRGERPRSPPQVVQREYIFFGGHPIPDEYGGGWCIEEGAHAHPYLPAVQEQYTAQQGGFVFRNDIEWWDYEYDHPIPVAYGGGWCSITEVHHHHYRPWLVYWWNPERRTYVYVNDVRPVSGQKVVRGTSPRERERERRSPRVVSMPATPVPPSGTVARPVPVAPTNGGTGGGVRPVPVEPSGGTARPVPVQPSEPARPSPRELPVKPVEIHEPQRLPGTVTVRPTPGEGHIPIVRPQPVEIDVPVRPREATPARPPVVTSPPGSMPPNPSRPPMVEPVRPHVDSRPKFEPPTYHEPPPVMNPHQPTTTVHNAPAARNAPATVHNAPAAVHNAPVMPSSTHSVMPAPAAPAAASRKATAAAVKSQRR